MNRSRPWPLALGIAVAITAFTAAVLLVAGIAVTAALRTFLMDRLDQEAAAVVESADALARDRDGDGLRLPSGSVLVGFRADGSIAGIATGQGAPAVSTGSIPAALRSDAAATPLDTDIGGMAYRVQVSDRGDAEGGLARAAAALPLSPVHETLERLVLIEVMVGLGALVAVAIGGYLITRSRLRPLARISADARRIGDLDLVGSHDDSLAARLPEEAGSAEVVDLSRSLRQMLCHIDDSLQARSEAEQKLRRFVADASHELRTPLTSIRGYAELSRRGIAADPETGSLAARRIEAEATRMGVLVDDLLLLARLDRGRPLDLAVVDLARLSREAADDASVGSGHRVDVDLPGEPALVRGDRDRLRQVLVNLLSNAVGHTPPDTAVRLTVSLEPKGVVVRVDDRGPGIAAEHRERVFEPFYRVDSGRSRDKGGSGLGLSIVKSLVEAHDGEVALESGMEGTTVTVRLPRAATLDSGPPPRPAADDAEPPT